VTDHLKSSGSLLMPHLIAVLFVEVCFASLFSPVTSAQSCVAPLHLPSKLEVYRTLIEKETGRRTCFTHGAGFNLASGKAEWRSDTTFNLVVIAPLYDVTDPANEWELAHELTHGRLIYGIHYPKLPYLW
jgi:hypothetical protein